MRISDNGINLIKNFEGCVLHVYKDCIGLDTIGIGHLIRDGENFTSITEKEAEDLLRQDIRICELSIQRLITSELNQNQFDSLCSFTFNLGSGALRSSTLRMKLNRGEYIQAAEEFVKWNRAGGIPRAGLTRRRLAEKELFLS